MQDLRRLVGREAREAYRVITRDQDLSLEPKGWLRRFLFRVKVVFLGLSYKLTPARRVLFAIAIVAALLGNLKFDVVTKTEHIRVDTSPLWFLVSIGILVFLLALELVDRVLVRDELEVARQLQRDLLPKQAPDLPGYRAAHSYRTANEVGGDYYDFIRLDDGRVVITMGDASGHGMAAALLMAIANAALKLAIDLDPAPERVARLLNRALFRTGDRRAFMTLFYGVLAPASGEMHYVCAGHPFPLLRRAGGEILELGRGGLPLGIREGLAIEEASVTLAPGDVLVLYSDGVSETVNAAGQAFGFERLRALLAAGGEPQRIHDAVLASVNAFRGEEPLVDDLSLVVLARG
jgi:sigma-B regulation protein RsbU (phosphoserine phosphatase)